MGPGDGQQLVIQAQRGERLHAVAPPVEAAVAVEQPLAALARHPRAEAQVAVDVVGVGHPPGSVERRHDAAVYGDVDEKSRSVPGTPILRGWRGRPRCDEMSSMPRDERYPG